MAFFPQLLGGLHWPNPQIRPPGLLIAKLVELSMMASAQGNGEFVADFEAQRSAAAQIAGDADRTADVRRQGKAAKQQISDALCHEAVWVLRSSKRFYRSGQGPDQVRAGQSRYRLTAGCPTICRPAFATQVS